PEHADARPPALPQPVAAAQSARPERRSRRQRTVLCPGAGKWELWTVAPGGAARLSGKFDSPADAPVGAHSVLALPVQHVFAAPLWLATTDADLFADMIFLQLEKIGVVPRSREETVMQFKRIATEETQTLVLVAVLPAAVPDSLEIAEIERFEISPRIFPLPS